MLRMLGTEAGGEAVDISQGRERTSGPSLERSGNLRTDRGGTRNLKKGGDRGAWSMHCSNGDSTWICVESSQVDSCAVAVGDDCPSCIPHRYSSNATLLQLGVCSGD